ncbi:nitrite reductase small subunit NirD [Ferrovibrio terrae]|uniref:Nitrite reductase small subunit NirD n=2 Tax=Ferrovibrio terrae TaxID=2594003 RepID=A0A516H7X8_9PROT|nr:nitrite reductase small subunit NirD [Ferrovibrio terrae]
MSNDWLDIGTLNDIPKRAARVVKTVRGDIAIFRTMDDQVFALDDKCPHKGGPLSQGIVQGDSVTCPLHNWVISLKTGEAQGADQGCTRTIAVKLQEGRILLSWPGLAVKAA